VLESVWAVIRGNMSLIISILTSTLSIVFGGGTAILNFVVAAVSTVHVFHFDFVFFFSTKSSVYAFSSHVHRALL
jgi:uncharacterized membrane protein